MESSQKFTRAFNLEHARAGAPFAAFDGQAVEMLKWDMNGRRPLFGLVGDLQREVRWSQDGTVTLYRKDPFDLVMLPLGFIDGKPVFTGDELIVRPQFASAGKKYSAKAHDGHHAILAEFCWPAPKVYPESQITDGEILAALEVVPDDSMYKKEFCEKTVARVRPVIAAALRHAIDAGQLVTTEAHEAALTLLGERLAGIAIDRPARRDMDIANAVLIACHRYADGYHQRCAREMMDIDLALIISGVKQ